MIGLLMLRLLILAVICKIACWIFDLVCYGTVGLMRILLIVFLVMLGLYASWLLGAFIWGLIFWL